MEDLLLKAALQGGPVVAVLALQAFVLVRYLIPLLDRALERHSDEIRQLCASHREGQRELARALQEGLDRVEARTDATLDRLLGKEGPRLRKTTRPIHIVPPVLLGLLLGVLCACTPAERAASNQAARTWAADFGRCAVVKVPQQTVDRVARDLSSPEAWRTAGLGAAGQTLTCALLALIDRQSQAEAPVEAPAGEVGVAARRSALQIDPVAQVQQLAQRCAQGPCVDLRERAAYRLQNGR